MLGPSAPSSARSAPTAPPNAVVAALLSGQPYIGNAQVVGQPYVTAYAPLMDGSKVIGALFVGTPQATVDAPLRTALATVKVSDHGYLTVLAADGSWVVPPLGASEGSALDADLRAVPDRLDAGTAQLVRTLLIAGFIVAALAIGFVVLTSGRIVARIGRLTAALRRVAPRDLSFDVRGEGRDEIGVMGDAGDRRSTRGVERYTSRVSPGGPCSRPTKPHAARPS